MPLSTLPQLPHHQWSRLHVSFDWIEWKRYPESEKVLRQDSHLSANWVIKGKLRQQVGTHTVEASTGEWTFRQPGRVRAYVAANTEIIHIGFSIRWSGEGKLQLSSAQPLWKCDPLPELEKKTLVLLNAVRDTMGSLIGHKMMGNQVRLDMHFLYHQLFYDWLRTWQMEMDQRGLGIYHIRDLDDKVANTMRYLEELPMNESFRVSDIASNLGVSTRHLTHLFHQVHGMGPKAWRMKLKLQNAIRELQTTGDNVKQIAARFGYSPVWFNIWIKRETNKTPLQWRIETRSQIKPPQCKNSRSKPRVRNHTLPPIVF
jgi:AraC-like DNA-binding protein